MRKFTLSLCAFQVSLVLDYPHSSEVKEQALCIIGNIASASISTDYIMEDESILKKLLEFVVSNIYRTLYNAPWGLDPYEVSNISRNTTRILIGKTANLMKILRVTIAEESLVIVIAVKGMDPLG